MALRRLGASPAVVTKTAAADRASLLADFDQAGIDVAWRPSAATTTFENTYLDPRLERRRQTVAAVAEPFDIDDLADARGRMLLLGPLTAGDMSIAFLRTAAARGAVCLDAQGMVRHVVDGHVEPGPWPDRDAGLAAVAFLKVDDAEAAALTGETDPERAAVLLSNLLGHPPREAIVSRAGDGASICADGHVHRIAALPVAEPVDATGLGDTFFAAYLHRRLAGENAPEAGHFAAATAALALGRFGPFADSEPDVLRLLAATGE